MSWLISFLIPKPNVYGIYHPAASAHLLLTFETQVGMLKNFMKKLIA
jgi:hypothetical protein